MAAPTYNWNTISVDQCDADSPIDEILMEGIRQNLIHLEEWMGKDYTAAQNHHHDGVDSALTPYNAAYAAGNNIIASLPAYGTKTGTSYQKAKEIMVARGGTLRISWRMCAIDDSGTAFGRIYRNGVAVGSEKTTENQSLTDMSDDIAGWSAGDLCQLYAKNDYESAYVGYDNFKLNNSFYIGEVVILD